MGYFVVWTAVTRPFICGWAMSRASLREVYTAMIIHRIIVVDLGLGIWFTLTIVNIFLHFAFIFVVVFFSYVFVEWVVSLKLRRAFVDTASNWEIYFVAVNRIIVVHQDTERYGDKSSTKRAFPNRVLPILKDLTFHKWYFTIFCDRRALLLHRETRP